MGSLDDIFMEKLREFNGIIKYAAKRYEIPGVLSKQDLYQEGCALLYKVVQEFDPSLDDTDFRKLFKTHLWHGLSHVLYRQKAKKRDWRQVAYFKEVSDPTLIADQDENADISSNLLDTYNPEQIAIAADGAALAEEFLGRLTARLDEDGKVILDELLNPKSWHEIPEKFKVNSTGDEYWRIPRKKLPQHVLAAMLDWSHTRVRRAIKRVKKQALIVGQELGIDGIELIVKRLSRHG